MKNFKEYLDEAGGFADKQIEKLRKEYSSIGKMSYERGLKLKNMVSKYPKDVLKQLAKGVYDETRVETVATFKEKYAPDFVDPTGILE